MFARFDENPAMTLQDIKETKRYGRTDGRTDGCTHGRTHARTDNVKTVYPPQTKFAGGLRGFAGGIISQIGRSYSYTCHMQNFNILASLYSLADWLES